MEKTLSVLAPTYQTYFCGRCGGLFYDLTDPAKLEEIKKAVAENVKKAKRRGE